ncbi:MAG: hypothetical protein A2075_21575 [Geobacteraceae bacterium GWC2_58_44]|nr:MAG: hypothetical protein A2075_21575 [Geobacteraceae bacterium GWC2_58_44]
MSEGRVTALPAETAQGLFEQGNARFGAGEREAAALSYRRALQIDPCFAAASFNLGCTLELLGGPGEALPHFARAAALRPDWCEARSNLGFALARVGRMAEAAAELQAAAALSPADAGIRNNLGLALSELGRGEEALASFQEAIRLDPLYPEAHSNLALLFERYGRSSEAISSCLQALKLCPDYPEAHHNLACTLKSQGRHQEAVAQYREALRLKPDYHEARSSLLFALCYPAGLAEEELAAEHRSFGALHRFPAPPHQNDRGCDRLLRIGYVSADFRAHAVVRFIEPVLRHHDRSRFQVFCYSNVAVPDARSASLRQLADRFVNIAGVPDQAAFEMIRRDRIDILVDLSGHTAGNRLPLFARKPAPVQVTWLGYPHGTGLEAIDYRITDAVTDPPGCSERLYAEKLVRLPGSFSCFAPPEEAPEVGELPLLSSGVITFGSFNNPAKITGETVSLWAGVLQGAPGSRMLVKGYALADPGSRGRLAALFAAHGVAPERLELLGNTASYREHLGLYRRVDIALDTFPYHGTTTTCEALWMGVPVVTLLGAGHRSRVGASLLGSVGLQRLVAQQAEGYRDAALELARDAARLAKLRRTLRQTMAASPLTDGRGFTGKLESAFREIWRNWAAGSREDRSVDRIALGQRLLQAGRLDRALREFLGALRCNPPEETALGGVQETLNREMAADLARALYRDAARLAAAPAAASEERIGAATLADCAELLHAMGLVTPAELICRHLLDRGERTPQLSRTLGEVALSIGEAACAAGQFRDAIGRGDGSLATRIRLVKAEESARVRPAPAKGERFLLIKAWGYGFWSDVNHVLGQLLLAEMTGRIPVVHWGGNSLFSDDPASNAFESFFEPVSRYTLKDLALGSRSYYPPKWSAANLASERVNQAEGPWSRCSSLYAFERAEQVVVSDFHYAVNDLAPWIAPGHPLHGMTTEQLYLQLFRRYLKVKPWIAAKVEAFFRQKMGGRIHLALHVRGGDKGGEDPNLERLNALYHPEIERYLLHTPQARLFLITDDKEILSSYLGRYRDRLLHTGATRTETAQGVHYQRHASRYRLAEEVIVDTLLAARCDSFIGNGLSNVSCAVAQMKGWPPGKLRLLGSRLDRLRQLTLYRN